MKDLKHLFTALLLLCTTVATAHNFKVNGIYYNITNSTNKTVAVTYQGNFSNAYSNEYTGSVTIPESVTYNGTTYSVTSIGYEAFYGCSGLTSVTIGNSVTSIGDDAFRNCSGLTSVVIPNSVTSIGSSAFSSCKGLVNIVIPNSVTSIGDYAFYNCSGLTSVEIPNSVTSIGDHAFYGCSGLTSVTIPNSVTSIGNSAFSGCTGLTSIEIPNSVTSIGSNAFRECTGLTSVVIPNSVTSIGNYAFEDCTGLKTVINFSNLTFSKGSSNNGYIAYYADTVINAPNGSVEGDFVFGVIDSVNTLCFYIGAGGDVTLPADYIGENYVIGADVFNNNTSLTSIEIPNSVTSIGPSAFNSCTSLTSIVIPSSVTSIGSSAFNACRGLTSVVIPNSVTSIGSYAFNFCDGLKEVHISDLSAWCNIAFASADANPLCYAHNLYLNGELVTDLVIPDGVTEIKYGAFSGCSGLTSVVIPNSVTSIGGSAFYECSGLTSVVIPNSVTSIGYFAFSGCSALKKVINFSSLKFSKESTDYGYVAYYAETVINVPNGVIEGDFVFAVIDGVNTLCAYIGAGGEVILPADYNGENYAIGSYAFSYCSALTSVVIGNSVTSVGDYAFRGCTGLTSIVIPNSVISIGGAAFYGCSALTSVEIPNSVTSIGGWAFRDCSSLTSVVIPNSVTSIGFNAFEDCNGLKEVHISDLSAWCGIGFGDTYTNPLYYAHNLYLNGELVTDLVIPDGVTEIKYGAFSGCSGLTSVVIPNSVTSIGAGAFSGCSGLKKVINFSSLKFSKGSTANGYVAYYADTVIDATNGSVEGDFVFAVIDGVNTLCLYVGDGSDVILPADYKGENYAIGADVFKNNTSLTSVVIPNSVTSIGEGAFSGCSGLKEVHISDLSAWCNIAFASADANPLYYAENLYLNDELLTELTIPDSVTEVKNFAFYNCTALTSIEILDGVTGIGEEAFRGCSDLEYIYISSTIESIGDYAFAECNNIFDIKIGSKKAVAASENVFSSDAYNNACLYVPTGRKDFYAKTSPWSNFIIKEMDFTGIENVKGESGKVKAIYDLNGRAVENPSSGIYILNGKKVIIK